jgi:hypothetical protein
MEWSFIELFNFPGWYQCIEIMSRRNSGCKISIARNVLQKSRNHIP